MRHSIIMRKTPRTLAARSLDRKDRKGGATVAKKKTWRPLRECCALMD